MSTFLSRDQIFAAPDIETEDVFVPQWNGTVRVKGLTASERDKFESQTTTQRGRDIELNRQNFRAKLVAMTVIDQEGKRIFSNSDIEALGGKSAASLDLLFATASRLSGISKSDEEELINLKNSESDQNDDSSSD